MQRLSYRLARLVGLAALTSLTACSISLDLPSLTPNPMPTAGEQRALSDAIFKAMTAAKVSGAIEISEVEPNEAQSGPEKWTICSRASISGDVRYYTYFVRGSTVVESRASVINDRCEARSYSPLTNIR